MGSDTHGANPQLLIEVLDARSFQLHVFYD